MAIPFWWKARLVVLACLGFWAVLTYGERLYRLEIVEGAVYHVRANQNTVLVIPIPPARGRILDDRGVVLATSEPRYAVTVIAGEVRDIPRTSRILAAALLASPLHIEHVIRRRLKVGPLDPVVVGRALDSAAVARVAAVKDRLAGVQLTIRPQRRYPLGKLASHELGYVGDISAEQYERLKRRGYAANDVVGQAGLEESYEHALRGRTGTQLASIDAMGHILHVEDGVPPLPGSDLHLSLDVGLQQFAEARLQKTLDELYAQNGERTAGAVVMMECRTGRLLCMASRPNFDPRLFARSISAKDYARLMDDPLHPLLSRVYQSAYPTGSTFKPLSASACLQSGICTPTSVFYCSGNYKGFNCFVRSGHGSINFTEALAQSCDVTFYRLGDLLGIRRMDKFAHAFGLGEKTGVDLPGEAPGLFATPAWKKRVYKEDWQWYDTINMAIGQGLMNATPLQMAVAVGAIANGGYIFKPHLVDSVETWNHRIAWRYRPRAWRRIPVKGKWLAAVRHGMAMVVDHGTGVAAQSPIIKIAGKTGTAEAVPTVDNPKGRNHVWFVSFAPVDHPQIVTICFVAKAGGYGGGVAAPIVKDVDEYWATHVRKPPRKAPGPKHVPHA